MGELESRRRWRSGPDAIALLVLMVVGFLPRVIALDADPPQDMHEMFFFDEGLWANNAHNRIVFGRWVTDEHIAPLLVAPAYTGALAMMYRVAGPGLVPARLLAGLSGFLACLVLFAGLRAFLSARDAFFPAAVLALSYFAVSYSRVAFVESFQLLFLAGAFAGTLAAARRPAWAVLAGVCFVLALLIKPSVAGLAPCFAIFWAMHWYRTRRGGTGIPFRAAAPAGFALGAGTLVAVVAVTLVAPHWEMLQAQLSLSLRRSLESQTGVPGLSARVLPFGWGGFGLVRGGFFLQTTVPLLAVTLLGIGRLTRSDPRPVSLAELLAWCWLLGGLLFLGTLHLQPPRRFLCLLPGVAVLGGLIFEGGTYVPRYASQPRRSDRVRGALAGGVLLGVAAFYLYPFAMPSANALGSMLGVRLGGVRGASLIVSAALVVGATVGGLRPPRPAVRNPDARPWRIPGAVFALVFLAAEPARFAAYAAHLTYSVRDASNDLAALTRSWPQEDKVIAGEGANTLALDTDLFAFTMRPGPLPGTAGINLDGMERFHPGAIVVQPLPLTRMLHRMSSGFAHCRTYHIWPTREGRPRYQVDLLVRPELAPTCRR